MCLFNLIQVYVLGVEFDEIHSNFECSNFVQTNIYDLKPDNEKNVFIEYESVNLFLDTNVNIGVVKEKPDDLSVKYELDLLPAVKSYFDNIPDSVLNSKEFSNARFVRNLFERTWAKAAMRSQLNASKTIVLTKDDFERSSTDKEFKFIM